MKIIDYSKKRKPKRFIPKDRAHRSCKCNECGQVMLVADLREHCILNHLEKNEAQK